MELEFEITKTDYDTFLKQHLTNELRKRKPTIILIPLIIGYSFGGQPFDLIKFLAGATITGLFFFAFYYLIPYFVSANRLKKAISKEPEFLKKKKISITADGLLSETETSSITRKWESIKSVNSNEEFVLLRFTDKNFCLIPKTAFSSQDEATEFLGMIRLEIFKRSANSSQNEKIPYKKGFICLIPIVGVYAGIVFIFQGIFRYKDKWFTLIGVGGILFTVVLYGTLFPELWNEKVKNEKNAELAIGWMNNLIKDIEFYKIKNGAYPESLDDVGSYTTYDPTQDIKGKNNCFNYILVGEKYLLFSSGIDRIPNTKDDIYPEICVVDSSKIGLLKYTCKTP